MSVSRRRFQFRWHAGMDPFLFIIVGETHIGWEEGGNNPGLVKENEICVTIIYSLIFKLTSTEQIFHVKNHQQIYKFVGANSLKFLYI